MTDGEVTRQRLAALRHYVSTLKEFGPATVEELERNLERQWAVLHGLQLAIECVLDVAAHLATTQGLGVPASHTEAIDLLGSSGVIDKDLSGRIRGMAGFRNVIVHEYVNVDLSRVARFLKHLDDFDEFTRAVGRHLEAGD